MKKVRFRLVRRLLFELVDLIIPDSRRLELFRGSLARAILGFSTATGLRLQRGVIFRPGFPSQMSIGPDCFIGSRTVFYVETPATITIGAKVSIAIESVIWTGSHEIGDETERAGPGLLSSIDIGDGAWIGIRSVIYKDVGAGSIVDTSTVVLTKVPPNTHVLGNPARPVKKLPVSTADETMDRVVQPA